MVISQNLLDKYEIQSEGFQGSFGTVYRARHKHNGLEVALKVLDPLEGESLEKLYERHQRESRVLGSLNHPNIIQVMNTGVEDGNYYIASRWVESTLEGLMRDSEKPMDESIVKKVSLEILEALEYAHSQKVIHGDIKPSNVLIDRNVKVKVADWGMAKYVRQTIGGSAYRYAYRSDGSRYANTDYSAPEVKRGEIYPASDIFSVGKIMIEMLTGYLEFRSGRLGDLEWILEKATEPEIGDRYRSIGEFMRGIKKIGGKNKPGFVDSISHDDNNAERVITLESPFPKEGVRKNSYRVIKDNTYSVALNKLRLEHSFGQQPNVLHPFVIHEGKKIIRPLTLRENIAVVVDDFKTDKPLSEKLIVNAYSYNTCGAILYHQNKKKYKYIPVFDPLFTSDDITQEQLSNLGFGFFQSQELERCSTLSVEQYSENDLFLSESEILEDEQWNFLMEEDRDLLKQYVRINLIVFGVVPRISHVDKSYPIPGINTINIVTLRNGGEVTASHLDYLSEFILIQ